MSNDDELAELRQRIGALWQEREDLKTRMESAPDAQTRRAAWRALEDLDACLSDLNSRFKRLWNAQSQPLRI